MLRLLSPRFFVSITVNKANTIRPNIVEARAAKFT